MTPINNSQMSEQVEKLKRDFGFMIKPEHLDRFMFIVESLISHERAEAVKEVLERIRTYKNGWVKQELENDEVVVKRVAPEYVVIEQLEEYLSNERFK